MEERRNLIDKIVLPKKKQGVSVNGTSQLGKMKKDDCEYILREVVTAIGESDSIDDITKKEKL